MSWDAQTTVDDLVAALDAELVYSTVDELAQAMYAQLATAREGPAGFLPWVRHNPSYKPRLSGLISTPRGLRRVTILLDTGATHCFI